MNNLLSYRGKVDARIRASNKDLPHRVVCAVLSSPNKRVTSLIDFHNYFPHPRLSISCQISPYLLISLLILHLLHPVLIISHLNVYWFYNFCTHSSSSVIKGHEILKCFLVSSISSKKQTKTHRNVVKTKSFVCFFGRIHGLTICLRN